jgi:hypothetical protein
MYDMTTCVSERWGGCVLAMGFGAGLSISLIRILLYWCHEYMDCEWNMSVICVNDD